MYMPAGTCYVYQTHGTMYCFNISSKECGAAVLLRALEPMEGVSEMQKFRQIKNEKHKGKPEFLANGPSKLCQAMAITKATCNKLDLTDPENDELWLEDDPNFDPDDMTVVKTSRIGLNSVKAGEWASKHLRYYILGSTSVSKKDKHAERRILDGENDDE